MGLLTVQTVKKLEFPKSKMAVKSPYLRNRLTDFDEISHGDADWPPTGDTPLKFPFFSKKNKMAAVVILKNHKSRYHNKGLTDLRLCEIWHDYAKWVS